MKNILILIFGIIFFTSCEKKEEKIACFNDDPFEVEWLNEIRQNMIDEGPSDFGTRSIVMYTYKGNKVFEVNSCIMCNDQGVSITDCNKVNICYFGGLTGANTCPDFYDTYTDKEVIFSL